MKDSIFELAYLKASEKYKEAAHAIFLELSNSNPDVEFDAIYQVSKRGLMLHIAALQFAEKVWSKSIPYEKAESFLIAQFSEFPQQTCTKALSNAYVQTR
jgi:hypothetical protein